MPPTTASRWVGSRPHRALVRLLSFVLAATTFYVPTIASAPPAAAAACTGSQFTVTRLHSPVFYSDFGDSIHGMYLGYAITNTTGAAIDDLWVTVDSFTGVVGLSSNEDGIQHFGTVAAGATVYAYFYVTTNATSNSTQNHTVSMFDGSTAPADEICDSAQSLTRVQNAISANANKVSIVTNGPNPPELGGILTITVTGATGTIGGAGIFALTPASRLDWQANAYQLVDVTMELRTPGSLPGSGTTYDDTLFLSGLPSPTQEYTIVYTFIAQGLTTAPTTVTPVNNISSGNPVKHTSTGTAEYQAIPPLQPTINRLWLSKSGSPVQLPTGGQATYTVTVHNDGTATGTLDKIIDTLPAGATFDTSVTPTYNGVPISDPAISGQQLTYSGTFTVPPGGTSTLTYGVVIPNVNGVYTNSVIGHVGPGPAIIDATRDVTNDSTPATASVNVGPLNADLSVTKSDGVTSVVAGDPTTQTYTITVSNNGPSLATNVILTDTWPAGITQGTITPSQGSCVGTPSFSCSLGSLSPASSATVTVTYTVPAGLDSGSFTNTASVTSDATDPNAANDTASDTNTVTENVTWTFAKTFADATVPAGTGGYTFTLTATNTGQSTADNVAITDTVAAGLTVTAVDCGGGTDGTAGNAVSCSYGTINPGQTVTVSVTFDVPAGTPEGTVSNTGSISSDESGPVTANDTIDVTENVILTLAKTFSVATITAGDPTTHSFDLAATNSGTTTADNVAITDTVAAGLTVTGTNCAALGGTDGTVGNAVSCSGLTVPPSATVTLTVDFTVAATVDTQTVSNVGTVASDEQAATNSNTATLDIAEDVALTLNKTFNADPVTAGSTGNTFTLQATNSGLSTADNVVATDTVDPALTVTSTNCAALGGADATVGNAVSCTLPTLAGGFSANLIVTFDVAADVDTQTVSNTASVTSDEQVATNSNTATVDVTEDVVLSATKAFAVDPVTAGSTGNVFTVEITNSGSSTADNVVATDAVDAALTVTGTDCAALGGTDATVGNNVSCTLPSVGAGASVTLTITFDVDASIDTQTVSNTATVASDEQVATNSNTATVDIAEDVVLSAAKAFTDPTVVAGGAASTFTITVTNSGVSSAENVVITDTVDPALTVTGTDCAAIGGTDTTVGNALACTLPGLAPMASATLTVTFDVDAGEAAATVSNTATVASDEQGATNSPAVTVDVVTDIALQLTKTFTPAAVNGGTTGNTFTVLVENTGTSDSANVVVTDTVDARLQVTAVDCGGGIDGTVGQNVSCTYPTLAAGGSATITVTYSVDASEETATIANTADAIDGAGNTATTTSSVAVAENVILAVTKLPSPPSVIAGTGGHQFTITVENLGTSDAETVRVTDAFDARLTVTLVDCGGGTDASAGQNVDCTYATLAPGGSATITVTYSVSPLVNAALVPNTALAVDADGNAGSGLSSVEVVEVIDLDVVKQFIPAAVAAGSTGNTFTLTVTNNGLSTATGVVVTDTVDARLQVTAVDCAGGTNASVGQNVDCTLATLGPGASVVLTVTYDVDSSVTPTSVGNQADVIDSDLNTATSLSSVSIFGSILLTTTKTFSPSPVVAGSTGNTFTVQVTNAGLSDTANVTITDAVDPTLQVTGVTCSGGTNNSTGQNVDCTFASLPAGTSVSAVVTYDVAETVDATTVSNVANVIDGSGNVGSAFATVDIDEAVSLTVTKTFVEDPVQQGTGPYTFTIAVTNGGVSDADNVTITDTVDTALTVTAVSVDTGGTCDPASNAVSCSVPTLGAGATTTVTVTYDVPAGASQTIANTAQASSDETVTISTGSDTLAIVNASAALTKTADLTVVNPGDTVTYTYTVTNDGDVYLSDIVVVDDAGTPADNSDDLTTTCDSAAWPVAPGASISCTLAVVVADDVTNTAVVTANPVDAGGIDIPSLADVSASDTEFVNVLITSMTIDKTTSTPIVPTGGTASYTYDVTNTGTDPLSSVSVTDDRCATPVFDSEVSGNADASFDPGEVWRYTCSVVLTGDVTNTAFATALDELGQTVTSPPDSVSVDVIDPSVVLRKFADATIVLPGTTINYTIEVENTGDDSLVNVVVTDDTCGGVTLTGGDAGTIGVLDVGETWTYTCSLVAGTTDVVNLADVTADDSLGRATVASDSVTVIVNEPPVIADDTADVNQDTPTPIDVLANDSDPDGVIDPASVTVLSGPTNGTVTVDPATGIITYTPDPGYVGPNSFTYEACDDDGVCGTATVTIDVNGAPVTTPDTGITNEATPLNLDVLANDTDPEGDPLTVTGFPTPPTNGTVVIEPDGTITYTPDPGFTGTEAFTYEVCDPSGACSTETVTVEINTPPDAVDDATGTLQDTPVVIDVLANDTDANGNLDPTTVTVLSGPTNGTTIVDPVTGEVTYTPDASFVGADTFVYEVCDTMGECDTAVVSVDVAAGNTPPVAVDDFDITDVDTPISVDVLANDTDAESNLDPTTVSIVAGPSNGTTSIDPVTGEITYTPNAGYAGPDQLTYEVCDTEGACDTAVLDLIVNEPPVVVDDTATTNEGTPVVIDLLANDSDADGTLDAFTTVVTSGPTNGTVAIDPDTGEATYTPDPGFFGIDTFTYQVCDDNGSCGTATVTVTVNGAPDTTPDTAVTNEGTLVSIDVLANDTDPETDPLTLTSIPTAPTFGTAVISGGLVDYTPAPGFSGTDTFTYEVCDASGACSIETVTVTVDGAPTAVDDGAVTPPATPVAIDVLANDSDPEGLLDPTSVSVLSGPANGATAVDPVTGAITYTPDPGFVGVDTFTYEVCDSATPAQCDTATVTVVIDDPVLNDPPAAVDDVAATDQDTPVTTDVLANDIDPEGGVMSVTQVTGLTAGATAVINPDNTITYTPPPGFVGIDTYTYEVCDDGVPVECSTATVTVTVNAPPVIVDDTAATDEGSAVVIDVLANDSDPDGFIDPTSVSVVSGPTSGTVVVDPVTGEVTYTPGPGFFGTDTFTYEACDDAGACNTATVTVGVNALPVVGDDTADAESGVPVVIDVLANDSDPDGTLDPATVSVVAGPSNGTIGVDPVTGEVTYTSNPGFVGTDTFTYEVCDDDGACSTATVTMSVNGPPAVVDDAASTNEGTATVVDVLANDSDPDGLDPASVSIVSSPANGTVTVNPDGTIEYTPDPGFWGTDAFSYEVCDSLGACSIGTVVMSVNGAPDAMPDVLTVDEGTSVNVDLLANDTDPEGDPLTITGFPTPPLGTVVIEPDGTVTYTPPPGFVGIDTFTYEVCDDSGACSVVSVSIRVNGLPTAVDDAAVTSVATPVDIDVLANDVDPENALDPATVSVVSGPANGSVSVDPVTGVVTYTPNAGFTGMDTFTYEVCDDAGACSQATVTIDVGNPPPLGAPDFAVTDEDTPVTIAVLANDADPAGEQLYLGTVSQPANGTVVVNPGGTITYTPDPDFSGVDTFTYEVCDFPPEIGGLGTSCETVTVTVTVVPINDPPTITSPTMIVVGPGDTIPPLLATDVEGGVITFTLVSGSLPPGVTLNPDGTFSGTSNVLGNYVFTVEICDDAGACTTVVLAIVIQALAVTGLGTELWLMLALLLLGAGALLVRFADEPAVGR